MRFIVHVPRHWTEELDDLGEATRSMPHLVSLVEELRGRLGNLAR